MAASYAEEYKKLIHKGLVDESYPIDGLCVQLPNGWYGIHSIIDKFANILKEYGYEEEMIPSVSTNHVFDQVPEKIQGDIQETILKITHTGLKPLEEPYFMGARPDLILPSLDLINARSYRNLPIRRIVSGFRYITHEKKEYALITDTEQPATDVIGIVFNLQEYEDEVKRNLEILFKILKEDCKLNTFAVRRAHSISVFAIFPNNQVLEVVVIRLYYQELAEALKLTVLGPDNKQTPPYIFNISIGSRAFAATVVTHSKENVVLPKNVMRAHGVSYQMEVAFDNVRVDNINKPYTKERFLAAVEQGVIFALLKDDNGVKIITVDGEEVLPMEKVEARLIEILNKHDELLEKASNEKFEQQYKESVQIVDEEKAPEGKAVLGLIMKDQTSIEVPEEKKYAVATLLVPIHH
jgi:prolyl-tRNA synthetase